MPNTVDPYALAEAAAVGLRQDPTHAAARAQYQDCLMALGLRAAAGILATPILPASIEGVIPWTSRRRRFQANLKAACERWPGLATLEGEWDRASADFQLHQSNDGNFHIRKLSAGELWRSWMGGLANHKSFVSRFVFDKAQTPLPMPYAFDGAGHGWLLQHLASVTESTFLSYSPAIYVVEPDPIALCILFHLHDFQALLRHPRLHLFAGPGALDALTAALRANRDRTIPRQFITLRLSAPGTPNLQATCEALIAQRQAETAQQLARVRSRYDARDLDYWRSRFPPRASASPGAGSVVNEQPRLRVLAITTRYSTVLRYSMEEMAAAISAAGHDVELAMEADDQSLEDRIVERLDRQDPDLLLLISRMRHENPNLPRNIPFVCWDQDNLACMRTKETTASLDVFTYIAGHAAVFGPFHLGWPARNCIPCFPAAAAHRHQPRVLNAEESARYGCDFSYVSNASGSPEELRAALAAAWKGNPTGEALFQALSAEILACSRAGRRFDHDGIKNFVSAQAAALGFTMPPETRHEFTVNLRTLADRCFRHATLEWVARYCHENKRTLKLYGSGWEKHPVLSSYACGRVDPGPALTAIYQASRINLQIIESGLVHSRFLDGIAAGGFFLAREFMLPHERAIADAQYNLARRCHALNIHTGHALLAATDPEVRRLWHTLRGPYEKSTDEQLACSLRLWRELVPHYVDLPHVDAIVFDDEAQFAVLAERYLQNPGLSRQIAADLRARVLGKHSYDARWEQFLGAVRSGLIGAM